MSAPSLLTHMKQWSLTFVLDFFNEVQSQVTHQPGFVRGAHGARMAAQSRASSATMGRAAGPQSSVLLAQPSGSL